MGKGGGGSGGGGGASSGTQETIQREAPGVESRKLALYDEAVKLAQQPVSIPAYQVAGPTGLEQTGFQQAATTGVGQQAVGQGITSLQAGLGSAFGAPNVSQFFNPYQSYVTDEINRQAQIGQNQLSAQAVQAGAFGGGREGVQRAELDRARLASIGQAQAQGFQTALGAAQQQQGLQAQTGLQAGQALGQFGAQQQAMQQGDIQSLLQAGGVQRALGQQALEAQRATSLAQQYEPYQRVEFLKNVMTNLPTGQSSITATTAPGSNPLAQAAGAGLGAYTAYSLLKRKEGGLVSIKKFQVGGAVVAEEVPVPVKKKQEGLFSDDEKFAFLAAPVIGSLLQAKTAPGQSNLQSLFGAVGEGVSQIPAVGLKIKELEGKKTTTQKGIRKASETENIGLGYNPKDEILLNVEDGAVTGIAKEVFKVSDSNKEINTQLEKINVRQTDGALRDLEEYLQTLSQKGEGGDLPGIGPIGGRNPFPSTEGKILRAKLQNVINIRLKDQSGAAVTDSEFNRFQDALAGGTTSTDQAALLEQVRGLRKGLETDKVNLINRIDPKGAKAFIEQGGITFFESPAYVKGQVTGAGIPIKEDPNVLVIDGEKLKFYGGVPHTLDTKTGVWKTKKLTTSKK
jgi:hypothetical protein